MDIIQHLMKIVTPILLGDSNDENRKNLLEKLYAVICARFADDENYSQFAAINIDNNDTGLFERFLPDAQQRNNLVRNLSNTTNVPEEDTTRLISRAIPLVYNELRNLAGIVALPTFLRTHLAPLATALPEWSYALVPASVLAILNLRAPTTPTTTGSLPPEENKEGSKMKALLPIVGLIILGALAWALLKSCQKTPEPVATPPAQTEVTAPTEPTPEQPAPEVVANKTEPVLTIKSTADNKLDSCSGMVGDDGLKNKLVDVINSIFGKEKECNMTIDTAYNNQMLAGDKLAQILPLVKDTPNAEVKIDGKNITVTTANPADAEKLIKQLKELLPDYNIVMGEGMAVAATQPEPATPETTTTEQPQTEQKEISQTEPTVFFEDGKLKFYFATSKADVAPDALDKAKEVLAAAKEGKKIGISGFTDSTGNAAKNAQLSKKRAEAVKTFLIKNGVPEAQLELVKPKDTIGAQGKDQEGRRVEVFVIEAEATTPDAEKTENTEMKKEETKK